MRLTQHYLSQTVAIACQHHRQGKKATIGECTGRKSIIVVSLTENFGCFRTCCGVGVTKTFLGQVEHLNKNYHSGIGQRYSGLEILSNLIFDYSVNGINKILFTVKSNLNLNLFSK